MYFCNQKYQKFLKSSMLHFGMCLSTRFPKSQKLLPLVVKQFVILHGNLRGHIREIRIRKKQQNPKQIPFAKDGILIIHCNLLLLLPTDTCYGLA